MRQLAHHNPAREILSAYSKHTKTEETLVYKISIDPPPAARLNCVNIVLTKLK